MKPSEIKVWSDEDGEQYFAADHPDPVSLALAIVRFELVTSAGGKLNEAIDVEMLFDLIDRLPEAIRTCDRYFSRPLDLSNPDSPHVICESTDPRGEGATMVNP